MAQHIDELTLSGVRSIVGGSTCYVMTRDGRGDVLIAGGTSVPTAGGAGYAKGCLFVDSNVVAGSRGLYENQGTTASCDFKLVGANKDVLAFPATIAVEGNTDAYVIAPQAGVLSSVLFSSLAALAKSDSNYVTFSITNLGQAGAGSTAMLAATAVNTTKATGGVAIAANTKLPLTLNATAENLVVAAGDRLLIRAAATGTLANTVTFPVYLLSFAA